MSDKDIINQILDDNNVEHVILVDEESNTFEMAQLGVIPLHGVVYAVLDLIAINHQRVSEEDAGVVILELDFDPEADEYFITTIEDDDIFNEVMEVYESLPME
ncbi:MAG: DUF1292 domain-containing protein [Candidatus Izemoplasmatales bacterium]|jgi:hypothetical protein|nr:DUF1292 domain-containing protein [bacterium]MDZ4197142.1 DUF1292 domain-containing protein [Candidatus Izemoplasmatales bacterium]